MTGSGYWLCGTRAVTRRTATSAAEPLPRWLRRWAAMGAPAAISYWPAFSSVSISHWISAAIL